MYLVVRVLAGNYELLAAGVAAQSLVTVFSPSL